MPIVDKFDELEQQTKVIKNHPLADESIELKIAYLDGLALMMNEDANIDKKELDFLKLMTRSFSLGEAACDDLVLFAKSPDDQRVKTSFEILQDNPNIRLLFMIDVIMMAHKDSIVKKVEEELIGKYATMLNIELELKQDLQKIVKNLIDKNSKELAKAIEKCSSISKDEIEFLMSFFGIKIVKKAKPNEKSEDEQIDKTNNFFAFNKSPFVSIASGVLGGTVAGSILASNAKKSIFDV